MSLPPVDYQFTSSYSNEQPLLPAVRTNAVTQVPPAKKITFYKSGDPQFAGIKMAINQRSFKSFNALMDDLSHKIPLPFGVRAITTPRGIHFINTLDQLEDGGCYLCSDKKYVTPLNTGVVNRKLGPQKVKQTASVLKRVVQDIKQEDYSMAFIQQSSRIPKKITLIKNGDITTQMPIILNRRNAQSFKVLLDEISEIMQFTVRKLYTIDGKRVLAGLGPPPHHSIIILKLSGGPVFMLQKEGLLSLSILGPYHRCGHHFSMAVMSNSPLGGIRERKSEVSAAPVFGELGVDNGGGQIDSMQGLLLCPNVLICVGQEPLKPILMQNPKKHSSEKLPGLASHSNTLGKKNEMNFGLKAKKSVIHPRSSLSNRSMRFSLSSEKSYMNGPATSPENGICSSNNGLKGEGLAPSLVNDDIEKKVYMNKDGSLSVEMKVCFHLLSDETLQWSTQIKKSSLMNQTLCEESDAMEDNQSEPREKMNQETSFEMEDSLYPCDADSYMSNLDESENEVTYCHCCSKSHSDYDIWKNPMHASQKEEPGITNTWYTHSSCSSTSSHQRIVHKKKASVESIHTSSSERKHSEHIIQETSDFSETLGNKRKNDRIKSCCCQDKNMQTSKSQKKLSEKMNDGASLASSENEHGSIVRKEREESRRSRARSNKSKCQYSVESQINTLEETSSVVRTISSCSIKEREEVIGCSSSPDSACSKSSKCSTFGTKNKVERISDNDPIPSYDKISCSNDDCPPKIATQVEVEKEDEDNEINSASENMVSNSLINDDVSRCSKRSKTRVFQSKVCNEEDKSDSSEMDIHSAALSASRIFSRSKCNQYDSKGDSKVSGGSSRGSTFKRKKTKGPLHGEDGEDGRSSSGITYSSENSNEVGKRDKGSQLSHTSSHSSVLSLSEAAANSEENSSRTSKCYSKSSRSSRKRTQREDTQVSSSISNCLESDGKNGADTAKNSTQENISNQGSSSESMCSKCGHITETGNNYLQCASSNDLLHSEAKSTCNEVRTSDNNDVSSQSSVAQSSKPRRKKRSNASLTYCSEDSEKESTTQFNFHSPVPPRGRPSSKNSRSVLMNINSASASNELEKTVDELQKEMAGSQLPETDTANEAEEKEGSGHEKKQIEEETVVQTEAASETCDQVIPSSLPNASPEEVVHEWLRRIPSESLLMKCEMEKDEETIELHAEISNCSRNQDSLENEGGEKEDAEVSERLTEKDCPQDEKASEIISEEAETNRGECQYPDVPSQNNHKKDLPSTIQISVQIMKALLTSKHETKLERSYSLPEVSPTLGKNLSKSANILIQCLATLQLLDEELDPSNKQSKCLDWFRYKELLNIFQAVWFGNILENGDANLGLQGKGQIKASSSFKEPNSKDGDFTTMTSSGIDLSSGDGGSGEENGVGANDCALLKEKRDKAKLPEEGKPEQEDGNVEEPEEHSQLLCSKLEEESAGAQEVIEAKEDQEHENNIELDKNSSHDDQNVDDTENKSNEDNILMETHADSMVKEVEENPSEEAGNNETEPDSSVNEAIDEKEAKINSKNQSVTKDDTESTNLSHQSTVKVSPLIQQRSSSQDPVWVLKLLKKIEKEFMAHYVSAMNEFKVKWNLTNSEELDLMIAELKEEVRRRIEKSVEEELNKIKSRTGKRVPKPPGNELRQESTPELENRRRRLTSMISHNINSNKQLQSEDIDKDDFFYNTIQEDETYDDQLKGEEYCPCDECMRKQMVAKTAQRTAEVMAKAPNPVLKAFDLQEILRMKNTSVARSKTEDHISEAEEEEEAQQEAKKTMESNGEEEAKCQEEQEEGQEEEEEEEEQEEGQEEEEEEKEEGQEEGQQEEEEQEEGQEEQEQEEQKEEQEEGQEEQEKEEQEQEGQEEEHEEEQENGQEEQEQEEEVEQEEGQGEQEEEEGQGEQEEGQEEQEEGQEEQEEGQGEQEQEEGQEEQEEGQGEQEQEEGQGEQEQEEGQGEQEQEEGQEEQEQEEGQEEQEQEEGQGEQEQEQGEGQEEQEEGQEEQEQPEVEQQESVKGEGEENEEEEKPNIEDEKKEGESIKEDEAEEEAKQEDEEKSEMESVKEKEEKEEEEETKEDIILGDSKEGEEDEEQEKDVIVEQDGEQGEKEVIYEENNQEMEAKSEGDKELNDEEEMVEDEPNVTDNSAVEMDEKESQGDEPAENVGEEEIPDSSEDNASLEAKGEACSETVEVEEEDENKDGSEAGEVEAEGEDSNESLQNPEDDRGIEETTEAPEKDSEGSFSQQSQEGSEYRSDGDESRKKISDENGSCGSDGESKLVIESKPAKMYPDSDEEAEEDQSSQESFRMGEDPPHENSKDSHRVSKKKKKNSNVIDQDDLDF
ncbi:retinitis pigmentosa 1-like 1 protein [Erythrolamprus reginae]|uniref:retinitis pigmentosa 1-like 1 protein n=1 Tax=Erythrolamprus reginae TaxID=121349 RepID=UPI00396CC183